MLASVVVNNHNYGRFLRAAIDSALAQTHPHVEVIVVDDGSTDGSQDIMASYGERITAVYKENGGQASAINAGFACSQGDIVFFLDSDDVLDPEIVSKVVTAFETDHDVVWVMFQLAVIDGDGMRTGVFRPPPHMPTRDGHLQDNILAFPFDMVRTSTSANAFSAHALRKIFPIPEAPYFAGADWYMSPMVGLFGRCVFLHEMGGGYRVHGSNVNWFERPEMQLDFKGLRRDLRYMEVSAAAIHHFAAVARMTPCKEILSVAYIGARMVSRKLAPAGHPFVDDTSWSLLRLGVVATGRRFDTRWPMKLMFIGWFAAMALAPRALAIQLARVWYFPSQRGPLKAALSLFYAPARSRPAPATHG